VGLGGTSCSPVCTDTLTFCDKAPALACTRQAITAAVVCSRHSSNHHAAPRLLRHETLRSLQQHPSACHSPPQAHQTRVLLAYCTRCRLGRCLAAWQQHAAIHSALQEAAAEQQYISRLRHRALAAWWREFLPAARTQRLLIDAATTVAEGMALSRQLHLQQQVLLGWREQVVAVQQRQQAAGWLLQQAWRRGLVLTWRAAAQRGRASWAAKEAAAAQYAARMLLLRAWRAWVRAWSGAGCVRVMQQKQLCAAAASCLRAWRTTTVQQQQQRASAVEAAAAAHQRKLVTSAWRLWRQWVKGRAQGRALLVDVQLQRQAAVLAQWRAAARQAAGLRACEAAAASFWRTRWVGLGQAARCCTLVHQCPCMLDAMTLLSKLFAYTGRCILAPDCGAKRADRYCLCAACAVSGAWRAASAAG
jgi:hypothetical protein